MSTIPSIEADPMNCKGVVVAFVPANGVVVLAAGTPVVPVDGWYTVATGVASVVVVPSYSL
jgi:hypothetical protein